MPHRILKVSENGMLDAYEAQRKARGYKSDPAQRAAAQRLQQLYTELIAFKAARRTALRKVFARPRMPRSVYFWGGVGRGKSFLMDCFFDAVPYQRKRRVHFHAFMQEVQNDLKNHNNEPDPLQKVADRIARHTRLLCFEVDHGTDYRLRTLEKMEIYLVPHDDAAEAKMREDFRRLAGSDGEAGEVEVLERRLPVVRRAPGVVWFDFATLCGGPRSQNDYLEIAREHHTVLLSRVPKMSAGQASEARRFTWLIDVLYDHRVTLVMSAEVEAAELYTEGHNAHEFVRTVSRLIEMRTREYLAEAHRVE
jgi:predicted ATPase